MVDLLNGFAVALTPENLLVALIGAVLGTLVGVLPGLGPTAGLALLIPISAGMEPAPAVILLAAIYYGATYGGSTTSILLNVPGEVSSVVTCLDGYPMARQGRAGPALAMAAIGSFVAGTASVVLLSVIAPLIAPLALAFGPPQFFALIVLALMAVISLSGTSIVRGLISGVLGMVIAMVGIDSITGAGRFTFDNVRLMAGIDFVPVVVGLFAIAELFASAEEGIPAVFKGKLTHLFPTWGDWKASALPILRGTTIGFGLGTLPGLTPAAASFIAYDVEKRVSKHPEKFGHGAIEGVAAPEAANNAAVGGGLVPLFSLGIPTSPTMAVLVGAFLLQGITPGPLIFQQHPDVVWGLIASMYIGNVALLALNLPLVGFWARLVSVPYKFVAPVILVVSIIGVYTLSNSMFDVWVMLIFGVVGYLFRKVAIPTAPLVLALVLAPMFENALRQSMSISRGDWTIFFGNPISALLLIAAAVLLAFSIFGRGNSRISSEEE